jgi:hypothetical protein
MRMIRLALTLVLPISLAHAGNPPKMKEGLWSIHGESIERPGEKKTEFTYKLCRNHDYDKAANALLKSVKGCNTLFKDQGGGKYEAASTCNVAGTTIISNGITTYKGQESMHSETRAKYTPALNGKTDETMTEDQQFIGQCPAGMKVGDTMGADGIIRHHD